MAKTKGSKSPTRAPRGKDANPRKYKKKTSPIVIDKVEYVDYKDVDLLNRQQQLDIANAIKIAREMALLPYAKRVASSSRTRPPRDGERRPRRDEGFEAPTEVAAVAGVGETDELEVADLEVADLVATDEEA